MPTLSQQLFARDQFRRQTAKRQLLEGIEESNRLGARVKELGRADYRQARPTTSRKLLLVQAPHRLPGAVGGIHGLKRRAISSRTFTNKARRRRRQLAGTSRSDRSVARGVRLNRPVQRIKAREQAARYKVKSKIPKKPSNYEELASRFSFLPTRRVRDYSLAQLYRSPQAITY